MAIGSDRDMQGALSQLEDSLKYARRQLQQAGATDDAGSKRAFMRAAIMELRDIAEGAEDLAGELRTEFVAACGHIQEQAAAAPSEGALDKEAALEEVPTGKMAEFRVLADRVIGVDGPDKERISMVIHGDIVVASVTTELGDPLYAHLFDKVKHAILERK